MNLRQLKERKIGIVAEMRAINDAAGDNELAGDALHNFGVLRDNLAKIEARIDRLALLDDAERRAAGTPVGTGDRHFEAALTEFRIARLIASQVPDLAGQVDAGREREICAEVARRSGRPAEGLTIPLAVLEQPVERRVVTTAIPAGGPGANIIANDFRPELYTDRLRAALRVRQMGATVLSGLVGNPVIPTLSGSATAGWVAENTAVVDSDPTFRQITMQPRHVGGRVEFSRNMLLQSSPGIEQILRDDLARTVAEAIDRAAIRGGGANEPTGILGTAGIGNLAMGTNGGPLTWNAVIDLIGAVDIANALGGSLGFMTNGQVVRNARRTLRTATDTASNFIMNAPAELAGYGVANTNLVPNNLVKGSASNCSALIFGDWSHLLIGYWSELDILVNPYEATAYPRGGVVVRAMATADIRLRHAAAFAAIQDVTTP